MAVIQTRIALYNKMAYFRITLLTLSFRSIPPTFESCDTLIIRIDKWNIRYR